MLGVGELYIYNIYLKRSKIRKNQTKNLVRLSSDTLTFWWRLLRYIYQYHTSKFWACFTEESQDKIKTGKWLDKQHRGIKERAKEHGYNQNTKKLYTFRARTISSGKHKILIRMLKYISEPLRNSFSEFIPWNIYIWIHTCHEEFTTRTQKDG